MVFSFFKTKACISQLFIADEKFMALDKNNLRVFKCEHLKRLGGFAQIGILVMTDWVGHFLCFAGETSM